ncbi:GerAB/ArcD/ProY family transporter [Neobacillus niacini]|uniref:GerAB/ArcD/ProY family transporter n=1 Tax=Neobacillus niacini TaxID=86668 RepID=UPI003983CF55
MEKAKISLYQLFVLILLLELGSAILVPLAMDAKQDAWMAILFGMVGGLFLYWVYYRLFFYYPDLSPPEYMQKLLGKILGNIIAFCYIIFFIYIAARVLRDFGEMLLTFAYLETPLFIVNALLMLVIIFAVSKGIEVVARTGELFFVFIYFLAIVGFILIAFSGLIDVNNLKPVLENGILSVGRVVLTQSIVFPYGEVFVFSMILPYVTDRKKAKMTGLFAVALSGINLSITMAINIGVLGVDLTSRSPFPLLSTIQSIQVAEFLERLDVFFMISTVICIFFKVSLFFYAAVSSTAVIFKIKKPSNLTYPLGMVVLFMSVTIASNYAEHLEEGLKFVTRYVHPFFFIMIPLLLLGIAFFKNRKNSNQS